MVAVSRSERQRPRRKMRRTKRAKSLRKSSAKYRAEMTAWARENGMCVGCYKVPPALDRVLCVACAGSLKRREATRKAKAREAGACATCCWRKPREGKSTCRKCADYAAAYWQKRKRERNEARRARPTDVLKLLSTGVREVHAVTSAFPVSERAVFRWLRDLENRQMLERFDVDGDADYTMVRLLPAGRSELERMAA